MSQQMLWQRWQISTWRPSTIELVENGLKIQHHAVACGHTRWPLIWSTWTNICTWTKNGQPLDSIWVHFECHAAQCTTIPASLDWNGTETCLSIPGFAVKNLWASLDGFELKNISLTFWIISPSWDPLRSQRWIWLVLNLQPCVCIGAASVNTFPHEYGNKGLNWNIQFW